jgi:hypothetical protein
MGFPGRILRRLIADGRITVQYCTEQYRRASFSEVLHIMYYPVQYLLNCAEVAGSRRRMKSSTLFSSPTTVTRGEKKKFFEGMAENEFDGVTIEVQPTCSTFSNPTDFSQRDPPPSSPYQSV